MELTYKAVIATNQPAGDLISSARIEKRGVGGWIDGRDARRMFVSSLNGSSVEDETKK